LSALRRNSVDASMDKIVGVISTAPKTRSKNDDDFADRLSSRYTVVLLIAFAVLVGIIEVCAAKSPAMRQKYNISKNAFLITRCESTPTIFLITSYSTGWLKIKYPTGEYALSPQTVV